MDLTGRFDFKLYNDWQRARRGQIAATARDLAEQIDALAGPDSREKSLAITKLEEAMFWVGAAIAREPADQYEAAAREMP